MKTSTISRLFAVILLLCACGMARADTPIVLFKSFAGNINFTGTEKSLRTKSNDVDPCAIASSVTMSLSGIPNGATVLAAYLYWAGSGSTPDYTVTFDGQTITAPATRQYSSATVGYDFFAGAADVTSQVKAKGNGSYTASGLTVQTSIFCAVEGVLGGFQLLVIYTNSNETFRVLNVYEGFQYIRYSAVDLTLANFQIPDPIGTLTGRVGHITWEGDTTLSGGGETLRYNGVEQTDSLNPSGNQFNSQSSVNGDTASYGIDFDAYTVKTPVIASGQKSAKTTYTSGQDLVLMNAEVIAAPNVPATDRGVTMTLNGTLTPSLPSTYTISVVNNGPMDEGGPLTVTGTLPGALIYGGATGTNWTCKAVGQVVTCTYSGTVARNTTLPPITLTVTPGANANGLVTFSVTVGGKLFDYYDGNDTSTVTTRIGTADFLPVFMFTDKQCVHNKPFGDAAQPCNPITFNPMPYANTDIHTYITYVVKGVPTALGSSDTTMQMRFALNCLNPTTSAGTKATYFVRNGITLTLPPCASGVNGAIPAQTSAAWSTATGILFPGGSPSSSVPGTTPPQPQDFLLRYQDVGRIELFVSDASGRLGSTGAFVSRPSQLKAYAQSSNAARDPASATDPLFVAAGANFSMFVAAMMPGMTTAAPNFGRETFDSTTNDAPFFVSFRVTPAATADGSPIDGMGEAATELPLAGALNTLSAGTLSGNQFHFDDVGVIRVEPLLLTGTPPQTSPGSYLGTGGIPGLPVNVGRFFPHHFNTIVKAPMTCVPAAQCPQDPAPNTKPSVAIGTMAYSGQPFAVEVHAMNALDKETKFYQQDLARAVALSAWTAPNGTTAQKNPMSGTTGAVLSAATVPASAFTAGVGTGNPVYTFPAVFAFDGNAPTANNWQQPISAYLRAIESTDDVTSARAQAVEGGARIVSGRTWVPNLQGAATVAMNVGIRAQLFGTLNGIPGWYDASTDSTSTFPLAMNYGDCKPLKGMTDCQLTLTVNNATTGAFTNGAGMVKLNAPGAGSSGLKQMWTTGPAWLPSSRGTLTYGAQRRPYVFLREIY